MARMSFEYFSRYTLRGKRWFFRIVAINGKTLAQSEGYANRQDMLSSVHSVMRRASTADVVAV